jgi:hypothetical protein
MDFSLTAHAKVINSIVFINIRMNALSSLLLVTLFIVPIIPANGAFLASSPPCTVRASIADAVIITDDSPYFGVLGASAACWYNKAGNTSGFLPLLIQHNGTLSDAQHRFLYAYMSPSNRTLLVLGEHLNTSYETLDLLGTPPTVSLALATHLFTNASSVLILPYDTMEAYRLDLLAAPLACYLDIPILLYDQNDAQLQMVCTQLHVTHVYIVGGISPNLTNVTFIPLEDETTITDTVLTTIGEDFGRISYLTMTNPGDVIPPTVLNTTTEQFKDHIANKKFIILGKTLDLSGSDTCVFSLEIPSGINSVHISGALLQKRVPFLERFSPIDPLLFLTLYDPQGHVVAYANSMGDAPGMTYLETETCNASGTYTVEARAYFGVKGGYFVQRGFSMVNADVQLSATISQLSTAHLPQIPQLSMLAPYLTAVHGGLIIANSSWELTDASYASVAQGSGAGPWYNESLIPFVNQKVNATVAQLNQTLTLLGAHGLLVSYLNGPAWLAILADTTMVPMYYYGPSDTDIPDRGLPSDNPYSLNATLSVGRLIGWDSQDVSVLIARTFFYEQVCGPSQNQSDWHHRFSFVFGEGFGETGGLFHQVPYAKVVRTYGFDAQVYGDFRNSRQVATRLHVYTGSNYIEYLGHGDWYWFPTAVYGFGLYSKNVDVMHAKTWVFEHPSVFLTGACLMGRTDGIPSTMSIGLTMLHAGCDAFVGATRETGSEAGLSVLENHLIVNNTSIGEALRGEKQVDKVPPTYLVRVLYGDPAFNPFEPNNGFSGQGRPILSS